MNYKKNYYVPLNFIRDTLETKKEDEKIWKVSLRLKLINTIKSLGFSDEDAKSYGWIITEYLIPSYRKWEG